MVCGTYREVRCATGTSRLRHGVDQATADAEITKFHLTFSV
jgi:hypothetical protein